MFDLDVILAAHGAGDDSPANALVTAWARDLQRTLVGVRVTTAFHHGHPGYSEALRAADRSSRLVVPLLTSDGYYADRLRREAMRAADSAGAVGTPVVLPPLGTHPLFVATLASRVAALVAEGECRPPEAQILVLGHGTARHPSSGAAARAIAAAIAAHCGLPTHVAYLDQSPTIEETIGLIAPSTRLLVLPALLGGGGHADVDVPSRVAAAAARRGLSRDRFEFLPDLGELSAPGTLLERLVQEARGNRLFLRVGARPSLLSQRQVEIVGAQLAPFGVDLRFVPIETAGDRDLTTAIHAFGADDPFTRDITDALRAGQIDCAVHSLKDLPLSADPRIVDAAILRRGSADEVLVSRADTHMSGLASGARIGVSCARRAAQLRRLRPDLVPVPIRGAVPARLTLVDRGDVDGVVLAAAGLERLGLQDRIAERFSIEAIVPAPGQGAIVVQCRADSPHLALLRRIDDRTTRVAVAAERAFSRRAGSRDALVPAAHATLDHGTIALRARLIDPASAQAWDAEASGSDPEAVALAALAALREQTVRRDARRSRGQVA